MAINFNPRNWHNWISVILVLPIIIVGVTAVFIAHDDELGTKDIDVTRAVNWLPGYGEAAMLAMRMEVRSSLTTADGQQWLGTKNGLYQVADGRARQVEELGGVEIRDLAAAPFGLVVAAKNGVWLKHAEGWDKVHKGDAWNAGARPDGAVAVTLKDQGVLLSGDGRAWTPDVGIQTALAAIPGETRVAKPIMLNNLIMDLHTGKAFFGKEWEWVWIDLIGLVMAFLGGTGVYMWWRAEKRKQGMAGA
jgi:hypothetical protein